MTQQPNYYKYATYGLIILIFLGFLGYSLTQSQSRAYSNGIEFGQQNAINIIVEDIKETGTAVILSESGNITLIPISYHNRELVAYTQSIIDKVNEQGYITLISGEEEITLLKVDLS